jgi:hypothetical protein
MFLIGWTFETHNAILQMESRRFPPKGTTMPRAWEASIPFSVAFFPAQAVIE